ncbi:MAG: hypothetical protein KTM48_01245, partial [Wolbachia endosymbiont of Pissodes strobi]|nr:hypothetical protein [Wolbachia endosymbiont of Pissodes strobi]
MYLGKLDSIPTEPTAKNNDNYKKTMEHKSGKEFTLAELEKEKKRRENIRRNSDPRQAAVSILQDENCTLIEQVAQLKNELEKATSTMRHVQTNQDKYHDVLMETLTEKNENRKKQAKTHTHTHTHTHINTTQPTPIVAA